MTIVESLRSTSLQGRALRDAAMEALGALPGYDWAGIYVLHGQMLVLDAYVGASTDHTHIPVGRGVCGTAVAENRNVVVSDVRELENYLVCSLETRSEIVVLIRDGERILGQIDVDGHEVGRFLAEDEKLLQELATLLADRWEG